MHGKKVVKRKTWLWVSIILIVALGILFFWQRNIIFNYGKKGGSKPHLSVKRINVHDIGEDRVSMTAQIMVSNPLLIELKANRLQYELFIDSTKILETDFVRPLSIKALDSIMIVLPIELLRDRLVKILNGFEKNHRDSADYTLKAKLYFEVPIAGEKIFIVNKTRRLPAFRLLKVESEDLHIDKFGLKNSDLSISLIVENPNIFEVSIRDVDYELNIGKDFHMEGDLKSVTTIPPRSKVELPLKMDVHTKNIGRFAWQALFEKKHTPFHIKLKCKMVSTDDTFKNLRLNITRDGRLDELKKH